MPNKLTVVIPVLNEGEELATTLKQIASEKCFWSVEVVAMQYYC